MKRWMRWLLLLQLAALVLAAGGALAVEESEDETSFGSVEERRLRLSLQEERQALRAREENLRLRELELKTMEAEVDKKLAALQQLRSEVAAMLEQKSDEDQARIRDLGKMYEKMEPGRAAVVLAELEEGLAVDILAAMKKKSAGRILGSMNQEKAAQLSAVYPELAR